MLHDSCLRITLFISSLRLRDEVPILNDKAHARDERVPQFPRILEPGNRATNGCPSSLAFGNLGITNPMARKRRMPGRPALSIVEGASPPNAATFSSLIKSSASDE